MRCGGGFRVGFTLVRAAAAAEASPSLALHAAPAAVDEAVRV